jgi:5-methylthioadenosine/S-adenosylhomocysteine deaminase
MSRITRKNFMKGAVGGALGLAGALPGDAVAQEAASDDEAASLMADEFILAGAMVLTMDDQRQAFEDGYVWIRNGRIHQVGATADLGAVPDGVSYRSVNRRLIMPGLINCHAHVSNGILKGIYDEIPLEVWFGGRLMWKVVDAMDGTVGEAGSQLSLLELMTMGVTTIANGTFGTGHAELLDGVLTAIERSGIRAVASRMTVDGVNESPTQFIPEAYRERPSAAADEVRRLQRRFNSSRISVAPEALGPLRCTPEMVVAMHDVAAQTGSHFFMHVADSREEYDESRRVFGHGGIIELGRLGVLGPKTLFAHMIWLDDDEIKLLADTQTGVSHNPVSNATWAGGLARLPELLDAGVRVGLGSDGAATNNSQNVWETMKMAMLFQKARLDTPTFGSAELALELMTRGGARALHMEDEIGSLEPGKRADLIVIDTERVALAPVQAVVSNLVYSNDPWAVRDVYVDGEAVVSDGVHRYLDRAQVIEQVEIAVGRLHERIPNHASYLAERSAWQWHRK